MIQNLMPIKSIIIQLLKLLLFFLKRHIFNRARVLIAAGLVWSPDLQRSLPGHLNTELI